MSLLTPADPVQRLFELSIDMLGTASAAGYFTRLNPAWEHALGWSLEELMSEPYISFAHPDDVEATRGRTKEPGRHRDIPTPAFANRYRARDGDYRLLEWTTVAEAGGRRRCVEACLGVESEREPFALRALRAPEVKADHRVATESLA